MELSQKEIDAIKHYKPVDEFDGERQFEEQKKNDQLKKEYFR